MKTIAWDVDDVLNDCMRLWLRYWVQKHPNCKIKYRDLKENPPHRILGISMERYQRSLDDFKASEIYKRMIPNSEIMSWFKKQGRKYRHIALSAVSLSSVPYSAEWVFKHFGKWIRTYHFVPSKRKGQKLPQYDKDKTGYFKRIEKVDVLVDDNLENIKAAEGAGVKGMVVPRPWNHSKVFRKPANEFRRNPDGFFGIPSGLRGFQLGSRDV